MRVTFHLIIGFAVWLLAAQISRAWTLDGGILFENNQALGFAGASSPIGEAAQINRFDVAVSLFEANANRGNSLNSCTGRANGVLDCGASATDSTLQSNVVYDIEGGAEARPNGMPFNRSIALDATWVAPPLATLVVEHVNNCNWLITSNASNPGYTYVIEHQPTSGGTWSVTYNGVDTCVGRLAPRRYRAVYRDSGNNRGSYSSSRVTQCITNPPQ